MNTSEALDRALDYMPQPFRQVRITLALLGLRLHQAQAYMRRGFMSLSRVHYCCMHQNPPQSILLTCASF